jgi:hypothetical protein
MMAWITAHSVLLVQVMALVIALDTALASTDLVKSSSTAQAIVATIGKIGGWILSFVSPKI